MALSKRSDPFDALAHPIRRGILVHLRAEPGLTAGAIAERFPAVSRAAVSRHLGILRSARLVRSRVNGRESHYTIVPESLTTTRDWFYAFDAMLEGSLDRLKARVESANEDG